MEGYGSGAGSLQINYGSGCGSRRPENIRIPNTGWNFSLVIIVLNKSKNWNSYFLIVSWNFKKELKCPKIGSWTSSFSVDCEEEEEEDGDHEERIEEKVGRHRIGTISLYTLHCLCVRCRSTWIPEASIFPDNIR